MIYNHYRKISDNNSIKLREFPPPQKINYSITQPKEKTCRHIASACNGVGLTGGKA
jgi:hypothetical protein